MKSYNYLKITILIVILSCYQLQQCYAQKKDPITGHWYSIYTYSGQYSRGIQNIYDMDPIENTKTPRLATINSPEEWKFIKDNVLTGRFLYIDYYRSGSTDTITSGGYENNRLVYELATSKPTTFTNFGPFEPAQQDSTNSNMYVAIGLDGIWYMTTANSSGTNKGYLVEYQEESEVFIPPVPTIGATIILPVPTGTTFTGSILTYSWKLLGVTQFTCSGSRTSTISCTIPPAGQLSVYDITVSDSIKSLTIKYWRYSLPYVELVYPNLGTTSEIITIQGQNFGTNKNMINVYGGANNQACTNVNILVSHTVITCTHAATTFQFPVRVEVGSSSNAFDQIKSQSFYERNSLVAIKQTASLGSKATTTTTLTRWRLSYTINGNRAYVGMFTNQQQLNFARPILSTFNGGPYLWISMKSINATTTILDSMGGPNDQRIASTGSTCSSIIYCPLPFVGPTAADQYFAYIPSTALYSRATGTSFAIFTMFGAMPTITDLATKYLNTTGGAINQVFVPLAGTTLFPYTKVNASIEGTALSNPVLYNSNSTLSVTVPSGTGVGKKMLYFLDQVQFVGASVSYNAPYLSSISGISSGMPSTSGGDIMVINGYNFGTDATKIVVMIGQKQCQSVSIVTAHYSIQCLVPSGGGSQLSVTVTVDSQLSSNSLSISYQAPTITSITNEIINNQNTLSISGTNFGDQSNQVTIKLPNQQPINPTSITQSTLTLILPSSSILNGDIVVSVSGQSITKSYQFKPYVLSTSQTGTQGGLVVVSGYSLNMKRADDSSCDIIVTLGGIPCQVVSVIYSTLYSNLSITVPPGSGSNLTLSISIDTQSTQYSLYSYLPPSIQSFNQSSHQLVINGTNFGRLNSNIIVIFPNQQSINSNQITINNNDTSIIVELPTSLVSGYFQLSVSNQLSPLQYLELQPIILQSSNASYGSDKSMSISGYYLNSMNSIGNQVGIILMVGQQQCLLQSNTKDSSDVYLLSCLYQGIEGGVVNIQLTVGNYSQSLTAYYPQPTLLSMNSTQSLTDNSVTIVGNNIGYQSNQISIIISTINQQQLLINIESLQDDTIIYLVPNNILSGNISIVVWNQQSTNSLPFVVTPVIDQVQGTLDTLGGSQLQLIGHHIMSIRSNNTSTDISIYFDGQEIDDYQYSYDDDNQQSISFNAPKGTGMNHSITLIVDGQSSIYQGLSYQLPQINNMVQSSRYLLINGEYFGDNVSNVQVLFINQSTIIQPINITDSTINLLLPKFLLNGDVQVIVDGQSSDPSTLSLKPILQSITTVDTTGGIITIGGLYLNNQSSAPSDHGLLITINGPNDEPQCNNIIKLGDDQDKSYLQCDIGQGTGINIPLTVTIGDQSDIILFSYGSPEISLLDIDPTTNRITVNGKNFGGLDELSIYIGDTQYDTFTPESTSDQIIFDPLPDQLNGKLYVTIDDGRSSNTETVLLYPLISNSTLMNISTRGVPSIVIDGLYFNKIDSDSIPTDIIVEIDSVPTESYNIESNQLITINLPSGTGINHVINITIQGRSSSLFYNYIAPSIESIIQLNDQSIVLSGNDYGLDIDDIQINDKSIALAKLINDTTIEATINNTTKNGLISITVNGQSSNQYLLNIKPNVTSVTSISPSGGNIILGGNHLNTLRSDSTNTKITITIGNDNCINIKSTSNNGLNCTIPFNHLYVNSTITLTIDDLQSTIKYSSQPPTLQSITSLDYLTKGNVTLTGDNFIDQNTTVQIGNTQCYNIKVVSSQSLICTFDANQLDDNNIGLDVTVNISGQSIKKPNLFHYNQKQQGCLIDCGKNGVCDKNEQCICLDGYIGSNCSIKIPSTSPNVLPTLNETGVQFKINPNVNYSSSLVQIQEVSSTGKIIKSINLDKLVWSLKNVSVSQQQYIGKEINNSSLNVIISINQYSTLTTINFAGDEFNASTNSFKQTVTVGNWSFADKTNNLLFIYSITSPTTIQHECNDTQSTFVTDSTSMINSVVMDSPAGTLIARFSNRMIRDNTTGLVTSIKSLPTTSDTKSTNYHIVLQVPSFNSSVVVDPLFYAFSKPQQPTTPNDCGLVSTSSSTTSSSIIIMILVTLSLLFISF